MCKESVIEKIQKLLSKTIENGCSQEEASSALALAQQLMAKYGVSTSECSEKDIVSEVSVTVGTKSVSSRQSLMAMYLAEHFGCAVYRCKRRAGDYLTFVGEGDRAAICKEAFIFAYKSFQLSWEAFHKTLHGDKGKYRNDYFTGFLNGIVAALEYNENKYSIVLVKSEKVEDYLYQKTAGRTAGVGVSRSGNESVEARGYSDGYEAQFSKGHRL